MKKLFYFIVLALFSVSCMTEIQDEVVFEPQKIQKTLKIAMGGDDTKIQLDENLKTVWTEGDQVAVFYNNTYASLGQFNGETGDHSAEITFETVEDYGDAIEDIVVVYPYTYDDPETSWWGVQPSFTIYDAELPEIYGMFPSTQVYQENSYGVGANIMVGSCTSTDLDNEEVILQSISGWVRLQIFGTGTVNRIVLTGNAGEQLNGNFLLDYKTLETTLEEPWDVDPSLNQIVLDCGEGVVLDPSTPTSFYISLLPGTFAEGFTVNVSGNGEFHKQTTTNEFVIERNKITKLLPFRYDMYDGEPIVTAVEDESKRTAYDNYIKVEVKGYQAYYALAVPDQGEFGYSPEEYAAIMVEDLSYGGMGKLLSENYEGSFYQITMGTNSYVGEGMPGTTGTLLILPLDGRSYDEYSVEDVKVFEFDTNPLVEGGSVDASAEQVYSHETWSGEVALDPYTEIGVKVSASAESWKYFYFAWLTEEAYGLTGGDAELLVDAILSNPASYPISPSDIDPVIVNTTLDPNQTIYFVSFFVDNDDKYGEVFAQSYTTEDLEKSEIILDTVTNLEDETTLKNTSALEVTLSPDMEVSKYKYVWTSTDYYNQYEGKTDAEMADAIFFGEVNGYSGFYEVLAEDLKDGKLVIEGHEYGSSYYLAILPYDEDGNPGNSAAIFEYDCVFELDEVITDASLFVGEPVVTLEAAEKMNGGYGESYYWLNGTTAEYSLAYTVTPAEGTEVKALIICPEASVDYGYDHNISDIQKASGLWAGNLPGQSYYTFGFTEKTTTDPRSMNVYGASAPSSIYILVSWKDAEGNYYYKEVDLSKEAELMFCDCLDLDETGEVTASYHSYLLAAATDATVTATPAGKQWGFVTVAEEAFVPAGMNAVFDFGVSSPGAFVFGAEADGVYVDAFGGMMTLTAEIKPVSETSGVVVISGLQGFDDDDNPIYGEIDKCCYYGLNEDVCSFYSAALLGGAVNTTAVEVTFGGGGMMPMAE